MTDFSQPLKDSRREAFARLLAEGQSVVDAHEKAGFKRHRQNAYRLVKNPDVAARVQWLKEQAAIRTGNTIEDITDQLDEAYKLAFGKLNPSAMVAASMGKAKLLGLIIERHQHSLKPISEMNEQELRQLLGQSGQDHGDRG